MPDHPERSISPDLEIDPLGTDEPQRRDRPDPEPVVVIAPAPSGGSSARFLPPLLVLFLCGIFLAYRTAAHDWRGLSAWLEGLWSPASSPVNPALALNSATEPQPEPAAPVPDAPANPAADEPAQAPPDPKAQVPAVDPAADAEREAEATRKRIEELEKFKAEQDRKLAETEDQRREKAEQDHIRRHFNLGPGPINRADIDRQIAAQHELLRRQMEEVMRRQMAWIEETQRRHFEQFRRGLDRDMNGAEGDANANDGAGGWPPRGFGFGMPMPVPGFDRNGRPQPPLMPRFGQRNARPGGEEEGEFRTPDGGVGRFRRFRSDDGAISRFEYRWQSSDPGMPVPPPPQPGRVFD
ncbi:MAG: hypothetical protein U0794_10245 [Isosphaeraceae bacterium]